MQELEKILEELKRIKDGNRKEKLYAKYPPNSKDQEVLNAYSQGYEDGTDNFYNAAAEIIRKHMNYGWIPVDERLPEVGEYVLGTNEYDEVMIYRYGWNSRHSRKMFFHECGAAAIITAWMPLPEPYRPKSKTPEERQEWKERMLRDFMKKGER